MADIFHISVVTDCEKGDKTCLAATLERKGETLQIIEAFIDHDGPGLSRDGMNAFRTLCLSETILRKALGLPLESDEVVHLKAQIERLQQQVAELATGEPES